MDFDRNHVLAQGFADPHDALGPGDIVIIGAGLAGLFTALRLAPLPVTVVAAAPELPGARHWGRLAAYRMARTLPGGASSPLAFNLQADGRRP